MKWAGIVLGALGAFVLAATVHPRLAGAALVLAGAALAYRRSKRLSGAVIVAGLLAAGFGAWSVSERPLPPASVDLPAGQYRGVSGDPLGLVRARVVIREGGHLIFAELHSHKVWGVDEATLIRESRRALRLQDVAEAPDPESDPTAGRLALEALADALSGNAPREEPTVPDGAQVLRRGDTYWGMFPNEFDHACPLAEVPDGTWTGKSSNPEYPAIVAIKVKARRLVDVVLTSFYHSDHGDAALTRLPHEMVAQQRIDVDIVTGATRTSYILRSAAFHACREALETKKVTGGR